ncbi:hypothetical protein [Pseudodesulfovibrio sp.]|uniref:hypothetical protein n=1 Tax=unclassified Pseudodesulfovibrio TaxID=2661612 RepID=UPI003B007A86
MLELLKFLLGFIPWIAFGLLAGPSVVRLEVAIWISLALSVVLSLRELRKGFILAWGTLLFFAAAALFVGLKQVWFMRDLNVLVAASMAAIAWISLLVGRPFVLQIAREEAPRESWDDPAFIAGCRHLTIIWGILFLVSLGVAATASLGHPGPSWLHTLLSSGTPIAGTIYTLRYKKKMKARR